MKHVGSQYRSKKTERWRRKTWTFYGLLHMRTSGSCLFLLSLGRHWTCICKLGTLYYIWITELISPSQRNSSAKSWQSANCIGQEETKNDIKRAMHLYVKLLLSIGPVTVWCRVVYRHYERTPSSSPLLHTDFIAFWRFGNRIKTEHKLLMFTVLSRTLCIILQGQTE